ncbi:tRNA dihydrouridine synthase DusB [Patescibacteria group bacterium]
MKFNWQKAKYPIVALSPMADYTDSPFSLICKKFGADVIYREMVSADALVHKSEKTLGMADFDKRERPIILQIFGSDPKVMAKAAKILEKKYNPDGIDINMGCPARKIISNFNGASLIKNPKLAAQIVQAVKKAVKCPVSVKTRTGWEKETEILKFSRVIERAGADALAIHGRTKKQGFGNKANWEIIGQVKKQLKIPVLVNGDIVDAESFKKAMEITKADGALIARGALGRPWIFKQIETIGSPAPDSKKLGEMVMEHAKLHIAHYGKKQGAITFRKHLIYYFKGMKGAKKIRQKAVAVETLEDIKKLLSIL